ncbi:MAG: cytochrome c-type biogenesis protein CcmH [Solirubrobacterales bacterium]|nr:cytochrome c-type biogenesis protein CcmH [Solirubrobacterales bacterium]MCB0859368.1 cytochrome c-type biogenesis protein CcmH [Solirubrobacterales bacterium]MCB1882634.1 cytochrome c-type biogenesis protein CcmH [Geminicoccaceae bacterium]
MKRLLAALAILLALAGPNLALAAEPQASLPQLEDEVMCPVCGTLLGLSHSPAAERERVFIRKLIAQGKTEDEIKDALVDEYGGQVLALPENRGIDVWAYAVPVIGLVLALIGVITAIIVWRRRRNDREDEPPEPGPSGEEADRLDKDMARFDL